MWRWTVVWQAFSLLLVRATLDFRFFSASKQFAPSEVNCIEVPKSTADKIERAYTEGGWRANRRFVRSILPMTTPTYPSELFFKNSVFKRIDRLLPEGADIVKEHAKLVQDINSLRQVMFVSPAFEENRDYEESIYHENIETSSTTTHRPRPSSSKSWLASTKDSSIPILLLGGNSNQRHVVKSPPLNFPKPTPVLSLVGTSVSPLVKHPYPFVMQESSRNPIKVCMTSMPMLYTTTTRRPSLWERLIKAILPR